MNNCKPNTAIMVINLCLIILCFGLFFSLSSYRDRDDFISGKSDSFKSVVIKTAPVQVDTNVFPDYSKYWIGITRCNRNYISDVLNCEWGYYKIVTTKFRLLLSNYLEFRQFLAEGLSYYYFLNNSTDYPAFS